MKKHTKKFLVASISFAAVVVAAVSFLNFDYLRGSVLEDVNLKTVELISNEQIQGEIVSENDHAIFFKNLEGGELVVIPRDSISAILN